MAKLSSGTRVYGSATVDTTLAAGNTTITGFANVATTLQVNSTFVANSTAVYANKIVDKDNGSFELNSDGTSYLTNLDITGYLSVSGTSDLSGVTTVYNRLTVTGTNQANLGILRVRSTSNLEGNTTITGFANVVGTGGAQPAMAVRSGTYGNFIVPQASQGAYTNLAANNDNLFYFSNGTINGGNLVIGTWTDRAAGFGIKFTGSTYDLTVVANTFVVAGNTTITGWATASSARGAVATPTAGQNNSALYVTGSDTAYGILFGADPATGKGWIQSQRTDGTATTYALKLNPAGGGVESAGIIESTSGGFKFPDATTQTTAATAGRIFALNTIFGL